MASWLNYLSHQDIEVAKSLAEEHTKEEVIAMATTQVRKDMLFSGLYIPLAAIFSFVVACTLYVPDLWPSRLCGGFSAIASMFIPIVVVLRAQVVQKKGLIIALAFYIIEDREEKVDTKRTQTP